MTKEKWFDIRAAAGSTRAQVFIFGVIVDYKWDEDDVSAKEFIDAIRPLGDFDLRINSPGGSVPAGNAIYNALRRHRGEVTVYIDGLAASMASVIAMAGNQVIMPANAMLMIHDPWMLAAGNSTDMRKAADTLDQFKVGLVAAYQEKTKMETAEIDRMMVAETWITAKEAVAMGFADQLEEPIKMAAQFDLSRYHNVPSAFLAPPPTATNKPKQEETTMKCQYCQGDLVDGACTCEGFSAANSPAANAEPVKAEPVNENDIRLAERQRINQIDALARKFPQVNGIGDLATSFRESGGTIAEFQDAILARMAPAQPTDSSDSAADGKTLTRAAFNALSQNDRRAFLKDGGKII